MSEIIRVKVHRGKHHRSKRRGHAKSLAPFSKKFEARFPRTFHAFSDLRAFFKKHPFFRALLICSHVGLLLFFLCMLFPEIAKGYSDTVGHFLRICLATCTSFFPFSFAEALTILAFLFLPVWFVTLILALIRKYKLRRIHRKMRYVLLTPVTAASLILCLFLFTFAPSYQATPLHESAGIDESVIETNDLYETLTYFVAEINADLLTLEQNEDGSTNMDLTFSELSSIVNLSYQNTASYSNLCPASGLPSKPLFTSEFLAKFGLAGVFTFFTGETNINTAYPDFCLPYATAHELAHARGIAYENDADFLAFVTCASSTHHYVRYSGYLNTLVSMLNEINLYLDDLEESDPLLAAEIQTEIQQILADLHPAVGEELKAYSAFYQEHTDAALSEAFHDVNDTYLKTQGQADGADSYQHLTALVVNFYVNYMV